MREQNVMSVRQRAHCALAAPSLTALSLAGLPSAGLAVKYLDVNGGVREKTVMMAASSAMPSQPAKWIPRNALNAHLHAHVLDAHADAVKVMLCHHVCTDHFLLTISVLTSPCSTSHLRCNAAARLQAGHEGVLSNLAARVVQVVMNAHVTNVVIPSTDNQHASATADVTTEDGNVKRETYTFRLLVGADGANSAVRKALQAAQPSAGWHMQEARSDSTGLAFKVLPAYVLLGHGLLLSCFVTLEVSSEQRARCRCSRCRHAQSCRTLVDR